MPVIQLTTSWLMNEVNSDHAYFWAMPCNELSRITNRLKCQIGSTSINHVSPRLTGIKSVHAMVYRCHHSRARVQPPHVMLFVRKSRVVSTPSVEAGQSKRIGALASSPPMRTELAMSQYQPSITGNNNHQ